MSASRWIKLLARHFQARRYGVFFLGNSHTKLPDRLRFGGQNKSFSTPDESLLIGDFINVLLDDEYGLRKLDDPPLTIVDIGANVGFFTNHAREQFPQAIIHAYEPSPDTSRYTTGNIAHDLTTFYEEGVAAQDGRAEMVSLGASMIARTARSEAGTITLTSFATVLQRIGGEIDLLKIDCEGAEWDFMVDPALFAHVKQIRMEYHLVEGRTLQDFKTMVSELGFAITRIEQNQGFGIAWLDRAA